MNITQRFPVLPFALTTLCVALSGCGGGSNNIAENPAAGTDSDVMVSCTGDNCVNVILDENPIESLNYTCGSVRGITNNQGVAICPIDSQVTYYLKAAGGKKQILLGTTPKVQGLLGSQTAVRFTLLNLAASTTELASLNDSQAKAGINIARFLYSINDYRLNGASYIATAPVNRIIINKTTKDLVESITSNVTLDDFKTDAYIEKIQPFLTASKKTLITVDETKKRLNNTILQLNAGLLSHTPETGGPSFGRVITGSTSPLNQFATLATYHSISRSGHSFGFGAEWIGAVSADSADKLIVYRKNNFNKTSYGTGGLNAFTQRINNMTYQVTDGANIGNQIKFSGKLLRDTAMIYTSDDYKSLLGNNVTVNTQDFGQWEQINSTAGFKGNAYFVKTDRVNTYLDNAVWKVAESVPVGDKYYFPLYAQIVITNTPEYVTACTAAGGTQCLSKQSVNIAILANGDIISDDMLDGVTPSCTAVDPETLELKDANGAVILQQQMIGTVRAATRFTENNKIILPFIVLSGERYKAKNLDGMVFGSQEGIVVGTQDNPVPIDTFKINIAGLDQKSNINATATGNPEVTSPAYWYNRYHYFTAQLVAQADADAEDDSATSKLTVTPLQRANAKNVFNTFQVNVSPCYKYPVK